MAQYKFTCPHCGKTWFVSSTEIARNKKLAKDISKAETLQKGTLFHGKKYLKQSEQIETLRRNYVQFNKCPNCNFIVSENSGILESNENGQGNAVRQSGGYSNYGIQENCGTGYKAVVIGLIILLPPIAVLFLLGKSPFKKKATIGCLVYCVLMSLYILPMILPTSSNNSGSANSEIGQVVEQNLTENKNTDGVIDGYYRLSIEDSVQDIWKNGIDFDTLNYVETDPMGCGLWTCKNGFTDLTTKKEHTYSARIGHNEKYQNGQATLFYLSIDGETLYWDEEQEDLFLETVGK
nr:hypothetical protein [uncultured Anaerotignum sp.]